LFFSPLRRRTCAAAPDEKVNLFVGWYAQNPGEVRHLGLEGNTFSAIEDGIESFLQYLGVHQKDLKTLLSHKFHLIGNS